MAGKQTRLQVDWDCSAYKDIQIDRKQAEASMTRWRDTREEQGDGQEDIVAASMDSDWITALSKWLDTPKAEVSAQLESNPRQFLAAHVQHLPEPLLRPLTSLVSPVERGTIAVIVQRRRAAATQDASRPAELEVEAGRRRLPVLSKTLLRRDAVRARPTAFAKPARGAPLDPPFPDHPAATVPGFQEARGREASKHTRYGPAHEGDLFSHPRLTRLMDEQDGEEEQEEAAREAEREQCEEVDEDEDEGEDGEPDEEADEMDLETFQLAVIERFVKGDVSG